MTDGRASVLAERLEALHRRIATAERAAGVAARIASVEARLADAEERLAGDSATQPPAAATAAAHAPSSGTVGGAEAASRASLDDALASDASPVVHRLAHELFEKRVAPFRFVRVPGDYYDRPLEWRRDVLGAASVHHLCKSIIMENTRAHPSVNGWQDPTNSKYYCVVVQYTSRFNNEKLCAHLHRLNGSKVAKKHFNLRLCPEDVSDSLSGFGHNGVSPVGLATPLPIILSHRITTLAPDFFFMGGGEVDVKLGMPSAEFVRAYSSQPLFVVDCTYDDEGGGGGGGGGDGPSGGDADDEPPCGR